MRWPWSKPPRKPLTLDELKQKYGEWSYADFCKYAKMEDLGDFINAGGLEGVLKLQADAEARNTT